MATLGVNWDRSGVDRPAYKTDVFTFGKSVPLLARKTLAMFDGFQSRISCLLCICSCSDSPDFIVVRDGMDATSPVIAQYCNTLNGEQIISSGQWTTGNARFLLLVSNHDLRVYCSFYDGHCDLSKDTLLLFSSKATFLNLFSLAVFTNPRS